MDVIICYLIGLLTVRFRWDFVSNRHPYYSCVVVWVQALKQHVSIRCHPWACSVVFGVLGTCPPSHGMCFLTASILLQDLHFLCPLFSLTFCLPILMSLIWIYIFCVFFLVLLSASQFWCHWVFEVFCLFFTVLLFFWLLMCRCDVLDIPPYSPPSRYLLIDLPDGRFPSWYLIWSLHLCACLLSKLPAFWAQYVSDWVGLSLSTLLSFLIFLLC